MELESLTCFLLHISRRYIAIIEQKMLLICYPVNLRKRGRFEHIQTVFRRISWLCRGIFELSIWDQNQNFSAFIHIAIDGLTKTYTLVPLSQADLILPDSIFKFSYCGIKLRSFVKFRQHTAKNQYRHSKQMFSEKELHSQSPNFHIHVSVSDLYIPTIDLPILLQEICGLILGI